MPVCDNVIRPNNRKNTRVSKKRKITDTQDEEKGHSLISSCKNLLWNNTALVQQDDKRVKVDENGNHHNDDNDNMASLPQHGTNQNENKTCVTFPNGLTVSTECNAFTEDSDLDLESLSEYSADNDYETITNNDNNSPKKSIFGSFFSPVFSFLNVAGYGNKNVTDATLKSYIKTTNNSSTETPTSEDGDSKLLDSSLSTNQNYTQLASYNNVSVSTDSDSEPQKNLQVEVDPYYFIKHIPEPPPEHWRKTVLPLPTRRTPKMCLVLDLDETLVHCSLTELTKYDMTFDVKAEGVVYKIYVRIRPYLYKFLERVSKLYEVILFTASMRVYADKVINLIDPKREVFRHRLFREHCILVQGNYIKDLRILGKYILTFLYISFQPWLFPLLI